MTVKEIALSVNKTERSVHNWIKNISEKNSGVYEKLSEAKKTSVAADYSLEETLLIIEKGLGKNAADIFRMNTNKTPEKNVQPVLNDYVTKEGLVEFGKVLVSEMFKQLLPLLQNKNQLEFKQDYYSILGYCNLKDIKLDFSMAIKYGKEARRISNELNKEIRKVPDERFGSVNSYHIEVLNKIFSL